jgi:peptidoglycan/LPS O-acetylase OafA/YrhL
VPPVVATQESELLRTSQRRYFPALTGMRIVAAMLVVFHHHGFPLKPQWAGLTTPLQQNGYVGVVLFFVLSGFLITYRNYEDARFEAGWMKSYLQNRFARIYPLVFLLMMLELLVAYSDHRKMDLGVIAVNLTLLKAYVSKWKFTLLPQTWSLSAEESFYVLAPLMILAVRRGRAWLPLVLVPLAGVLFALTPVNAPASFTDTLYFEATYTFFGAFVQFALGGLVAIALIKLRPKLEGSRFPVFTILGLGGFVSSFHWLGMQTYDPKVTAAVLMTGNTAAWFSHMGIAIVGLFMPLAIAVFYYGLVVETSWIRSFLSLPLMVTLGNSSYAFYLLQQGAIDDFIVAHVTGDWGLRIVLLLVLSVVLHRLVEVPLNARLRAGRPTPRVQPA